jgi:hypothetical protein
VQAALRVGRSDDPLEGEADRIADAVLAGGGRPLPPTLRAYFEPRFGRDLGRVRVHTGPGAARATGAIEARAFTRGRDIAFGAGEYAPDRPEGRRLIAHELAHVVQQERGGRHIRRTVSPASSRCAANVNGAPANPLDELDVADRRAQSMALGSSHVLFVESLVHRDPTFGPGEAFAAYQRRFGRPDVTSTGRFRNRFTGAVRASEDDVITAELQVLSDRFARLHRFLAGDIRYRCPGTRTIDIGECRGRCGTDDVAITCGAGRDDRKIGICPDFWNISANDQRAGGLIHEAVHMRFDVSGHASASRAQRGRNPECFTSFVADLFGFSPFDPRCPAIITLPPVVFGP